MNIPYTTIKPFEPLGIPVLTNKRATLDELIQRLNKLMDAREDAKVYVLVSPDNPVYDYVKKNL